MKRALLFAVTVYCASAVTPSAGQTILPKTTTFDRAAYLRKMKPSEFYLYHWAVYRPVVLLQKTSQFSRRVDRVRYGRYNPAAHTQAKTVRGTRVTEFRNRPEAVLAGRSGSSKTYPYNKGPMWVARRAIQVRSSSLYDFYTADGTGQRSQRVHAFHWSVFDPPPPFTTYWPDRKRPDWFDQKLYRLFVAHEAKAWWARSDSGQWDLIDQGELVQEDGEGPMIIDPNIRFGGEY